MSSKRRKAAVSKGTVIKVVLIIAIVIIALIVLMRTLRSKVDEEFASTDTTEVQTAEVTTGSISTTVSSSGTLTNQDSEDIVIPETVDVKEIYVSAGEEVTKGDMLASVNSVSVMEAMADIQAEIDDLDAQIEDLSDTDTEDTITAGVSGRVKKIYAKAGKAVSDIMYKKNALMLISVDGYMAVDVDTTELSEGDSVTVKDSDGTSYTGTVDSVWAGTATILITDKNTEYNDKVKVYKKGSKVGSGRLYIHESVAVTGYAGTVKAVKVSEEEEVDEGDTLMTLEDISTSTNYATLLEQREDLEDDLQDLIVIYKEGAVYAQESGLITSVTETEDDTTTTTSVAQGYGMESGAVTTMTSSSSDSESDDTVITMCPTDEMTITLSVDESDILSLALDQEASITIDSLGDDTYTGTVTDIDTTGTSSSGVTAYTAIVTLEKQEGMLDGMSASVAITIEGKDNALLVPSEAVHQTSSTSYVYTSYDEETGEYGDMVEVTTGISNGTYTEITDGLSEGDTVYYTEEEDSNGFDFGNFNNGQMPDMGNMQMPSGGSGMPSGGGGMPSGGGMQSGKH